MSGKEEMYVRSIKKTKQHIGFLLRENEEPKEASLDNGKINYAINWKTWIRISSTRVKAEHWYCYVLSSHIPELSPKHKTSVQLIMRSWVPEENAKTFLHPFVSFTVSDFLKAEWYQGKKKKIAFSSIPDKSTNLTGLQEDRAYITLSLCPAGEVKCPFCLSCGWI